MKNNSLGTKVLMAAVTLALLAYFGFQAARYFSDPLSTTLAYAYQVEDGVSLSGYVIREEQVLDTEESGLLRLQREEGERTSNGGVIAMVYADQASLDRQMEIDALTARIEQLQYAQETAMGVEAAKTLDAQIRQNILDYRAALTAGSLYDAEKQGTELRSQVLKQDYAGSDIEDPEGQLAELQAQRKRLRSQAAGSVRRITAPMSGLYSAVVDGYETVLTPAGLAELTPSLLSAVRADEQARSNVGKLILGRDWYYAAIMKTEEAEDLAETAAALEKAGGSLILRFAKGVERDLPVSVASIGPEESGRSVVVFRGSVYLSQLTLLRHQSAQVIYHTLEGIRVPREAVRVITKAVENEDGSTREVQVSGVYCVLGREAYFKPVEILYAGENYSLVRTDPSTSSEELRLRPGDEVIVMAKNLYDGKVVG